MFKNRKIVMPTDAEDAAINRGIAADPDTAEVSKDEIQQMQPLGDRVKGRGGRPKLENPKEPVSLRLDKELVETLRGGGDKWQSRVNNVVRAWAIDAQLLIEKSGEPATGSTQRIKLYAVLHQEPPEWNFRKTEIDLNGSAVVKRGRVGYLEVPGAFNLLPSGPLLKDRIHPRLVLSKEAGHELNEQQALEKFGPVHEYASETATSD